MKNFLILAFFTIFTLLVNAQTNKFTIGFEYSLSFSNVTSPLFWNDEGFRVSHNAVIKAGYGVKTNLQLTLGAGILNTRQFQSLDFADLQDIKKIDFYINHNYFVVPFGLKYNFGSFYINPEASFAIDVGHPGKQITYFNNGHIVEEHFDGVSGFYNELTFPVFLSFGNEFDLGNWKILLGAKAYYSFTKLHSGPMTLPEHYYGFGLVTGMKF